jgi:hypothetical protein
MSAIPVRLRTERVILEVTYDAAQWEPPSSWDWFEALADGYAQRPDPNHLKVAVIDSEEVEP